MSTTVLTVTAVAAPLVCLSSTPHQQQTLKTEQEMALSTLPLLTLL